MRWQTIKRGTIGNFYPAFAIPSAAMTIRFTGLWRTPIIPRNTGLWRLRAPFDLAISPYAGAE
jgi:hypothetical protein